MRQLLFLSLLWKGINIADPSSIACCRKKTVGGVPYTLVDETDTSSFNCVSNCVYERDDSPGWTRVCFGKGSLEVVCKVGTQTTPPPIITNSTRIEGNETVVQVNTYQPATGVLEIEVSAHKNYPKTMFLHHQDSEMSMQKSANVCQLSDLPLDLDVSEAASQFSRKNNFVKENRYSLKQRESKLSFEERSKLIPEIQGNCENAQMVKTRDFDITQDQYEKFNRGEVITLGDKPKTRQKDKTTTIIPEKCFAEPKCVQAGPSGCGTWFIQITSNTGPDVQINIHKYSDSALCVNCNYFDYDCEGQTPPCDCHCKCSSITSLAELKHCHVPGSITSQFKSNGNQESQIMEWKRMQEGTSFTFKTPTMAAVFANLFGSSRQNNDKNPLLVKFGTECHIFPMTDNYDFYVFDIKEITSGKEYTTENDDLDKFLLLVDVGLQTTDEEAALHEDMKSQCQGQPTYNSVVASIEKLQSQNLKNFKNIVLETLSSRENCKLQKVAVSKGFADWRYPIQEGGKLWIHETIHFVDELTCCQSNVSCSSCCDDNFPDADKCMADNGCGVKCVISGDIYTDHHDPSHFHVDNIFTHNKEETSYEGYWIAPDHTQGNFIINLGCRLTFHSIKVVNTHNQNHRDRSTKKFRLSVSKTQAGPWSTVLETTLEDSRQQRDPLPVQQIDLQSTANGQFLKFELLEWYGHGGGLQFFDINQGCQAGWERFGSSCFRAFSNPVTWSQAQAACQTEHGNLASILDSTTNNGVANLFETIPNSIPNSDRMWIGLFRPSRGSAWEWVSKSPLNYEGWSQGSPSEDGDCAEIIKDQGWNDLDCDAHKRLYVCEKFQGPVWRKVYSLNTAGGLFNSLDDAKKKNIDDPEADLFSILYDLESMRNREEVFHFKLCYPELTQCNEWVQSSNPVTESTITGYAAITLSWNVRGGGGAFQGLGLSPTSINNNLIDDVPDNFYWWGSIGTLTYYGGSDTVPAIYPSTVVKKVELSVLFTPSG